MEQSIFFIEVEIISEVCVLHLKGFLDANTSVTLENQIRAEIKNEFYKIVLDFENLSYISSAGLGIFMLFIENLRENNGDFVFANLPKNILNVITLLGFHEIFRLAENVDSAVNIFIQPNQ